MQSQRWAWTYRYGKPLLIASIVAVVLAGGGLVTAVALSGGDSSGGGQLGAGPGTDGPSPDGTSPEPTSPEPTTPRSPGSEDAGDDDDAADCVIGTWQTVAEHQVLTVGEITLIGSSGRVIEHRADDTGLIDYGDGVDYFIRDTTFGGLGSGDAVVAGTISFDYTIDGSRMRYVNSVSEATMTNEVGASYPQDISSEPFEFTCEGDSMTHQIGDRYLAELERISS